MGSILQTTLNTRVLPTGNFRYVRSDYPGKLTDDEVRWLYQNDITIMDLWILSTGKNLSKTRHTVVLFTLVR